MCFARTGRLERRCTVSPRQGSLGHQGRRNARERDEGGVDFDNRLELDDVEPVFSDERGDYQVAGSL